MTTFWKCLWQSLNLYSCNESAHFYIPSGCRNHSLICCLVSFPLSVVLGRSNRISQDENSPSDNHQTIPYTGSKSMKSSRVRQGHILLMLLKFLNAIRPMETLCFRELLVTAAPIQNYCPQEPHPYSFVNFKVCRNTM